jgi:hypothetical protein
MLTITSLAAPAPAATRARPLFDIGDDLETLEALLDEVDGEDTDEVDLARQNIIDDWFAQLTGELDEKLDRYCRLIAHLEGVAAARKAERDRIAALVKRDENKAAALKDRLKLFLAARGEKKYETGLYSLTVAQNGGHAPLTIAEDRLEDAFVRVVREPDKDAIRAALKAGGVVQGVTVLERGTHLRIR